VSAGGAGGAGRRRERGRRERGRRRRARGAASRGRASPAAAHPSRSRAAGGARDGDGRGGRAPGAQARPGPGDGRGGGDRDGPGGVDGRRVAGADERVRAPAVGGAVGAEAARVHKMRRQLRPGAAAGVGDRHRAGGARVGAAVAELAALVVAPAPGARPAGGPRARKVCAGSDVRGAGESAAAREGDGLGRGVGAAVARRAELAEAVRAPASEEGK
jgi:hypothetical protein